MNAEESAFVERVHGLASLAREHDIVRVNALTEVRTKLRELNEIIDQATPHVIAEAQSVGAILYLSQERLGIAVPVTEQAKRPPHHDLPPGGKGVRLAALAAVSVALVGGVVGAGSFTKRETTMAKSVAKNKGDASGYLVAAREAQIRKEWKAAAESYDMAHECGAGAECSLGRMAECQFYAGMTEGVKETLGRLEKETHGESATVPYLRGLIAFQEKDYTTARTSLKVAQMAGHAMAEFALRRIP